MTTVAELIAGLARWLNRLMPDDARTGEFGDVTRPVAAGERAGQAGRRIRELVRQARAGRVALCRLAVQRQPKNIRLG